MMSHWVFLFLLTIHITSGSSDSNAFPPGSCSVEFNACEIHESNLLMSVTGVSTVEECRQICYDSGDCAYISYFGNNSFPLSNVCLVVSDCSTLHTCQDCVTEDKYCHKTCSDNVEGPLGENIVETIPDVENELLCKMKCNNNTDCNFYTHHNSSDPNYPNLCFLLTEIQKPLQTCDFCNTGAVECFSSSICTFLLHDGSSMTDALLFTETSNTVILRSVSVGTCQLNIMAIGGGGNGGDHIIETGNQAGGGGGSGEVTIVSYVPRKSTYLLVSVGGPEEQSSVETGEGELVLLVQPGANGNNSDGGNGYSGGGGDGLERVGSGGSNGQDGESGSRGSGGQGSGIDISIFELEWFNISPGAGGNDTCGGGGGGLLINGTGPEIQSGQGLGYGGGGEGCKSDSHVGSPGAILMEIKKQVL